MEKKENNKAHYFFLFMAFCFLCNNYVFSSLIMIILNLYCLPHKNFRELIKKIFEKRAPKVSFEEFLLEMKNLVVIISIILLVFQIASFSKEVDKQEEQAKQQVQQEQKQATPEEIEACNESKKIAKNLIENLKKDGYITFEEVNSIGENVYYYDEESWSQLQYQYKKLLYESLKTLNTVDNCKNYKNFKVKSSINGEILIDVLGIRK